ncbi:CHAP domain-containing protein [Aeromicrobium sp. P5_D10]
MSRSPFALAVLLFAALLVPTNPAQAAYTVLCSGYTSCQDKGYPHAGYSSHKGTSYWNMYTGTNCTNYVAYRLVTTNGMPNKRPKSGVGNARDWGTTMASVTDSVPTVGSVAWWGKTGNHVAYVEKVVSSSEVWVSESNWSGAFDWRRITKSGSGWPDGFIHFSDPRIINETKPAVVGTPKVDAAIKASGGVWSPKGNTYAYQWLADGTAIRGATAKTFTPSAAQAAKKLAVQVTATRPSYPTVKVTSPAVEVALGAFTQASSPVLPASPRVDTPLTVTAGAVTPAAATRAYAWFADGSTIKGAQSATFTPGPEYAGKGLSVRITSIRPGYMTHVARTPRTVAVAAGSLTNTVQPAVSGVAAVGSRLTTTPGTWSKPGLAFSYQWRASGMPIAGATGASYDIAPNLLGKTIDVVVTASRSGYVTTTSTSRASKAVVTGTFSSRTSPAVSGTPRVGSRLTASTGVWSPAGTYSFQWYAGATPIAGATGQTYVPTRQDLGDRIQVGVTARRDGFTAASARSARTAAVVAGHISISKSPRATGKPRLGSVLRIAPGVQSPAQTSLSYQWLRDSKAIPGSTKSTRRVTKDDLGHYLTVKVTFRASGYATRTATTAKIGRAKADSKVSASVKTPGRGKATFSIKVSAPGATSPNGTLTIRTGSKKLLTVKVKRGRALAALTRQPAGRRTYTLTFNGTSAVAGSSHTRTITIK